MDFDQESNLLAICYSKKVDGTPKFRALSIFLCLVNLGATSILCSFCLLGRSQTKTFDVIFKSYNLFFIFVVASLIWVMTTRYSHSGNVCFGDYLDDTKQMYSD